MLISKNISIIVINYIFYKKKLICTAKLLVYYLQESGKHQNGNRID